MEVLKEKAGSFSDVKFFLREIKSGNRDSKESETCL